MRFVVICLAIALSCMFPKPVGAALVASDSFAYSSGQTLSAIGSGGSGWSDNWGNTSSGVATTVAGNLSYPGLISTGNSVVTNASAGPQTYAYRNFSQAVGTAGTSLWIGFLVQPLNNGNTSYYDGISLDGGTGSNAGLFIGKSSDGAGGDVDWVLENSGGGAAQASSIAATTGTTAYLVVDLNFTAGNTAVSLYVDPTIGAPLPNTPSAFKDDTDLGTNFDIALNTNSQSQFDELRVGSTFADIAPVPEPASASVVGLACVCLVANRRKHKRAKV